MLQAAVDKGKSRRGRIRAWLGKRECYTAAMSLPPLPKNPFLPNFCQWRLWLAGFTLSQLLAFIIVLSPVGVPGYQIEVLLHVSLFTHAVTLTSVLLLCLGRRWLDSQYDPLAAALSYLLVLLVTAIYSHIAWTYVVNPVTLLGPAPGLDQLVVTPMRDGKQQLAIRVQGEFSLVPVRYHLFMFRNISISAILGAIVLRYLYLSYQWRLKTEAEAEFRVQALQSRIHPHFLFNSMNTIASLTQIDANLAEQAVEDLSELFRASLGDAKNRVTLQDELRLCTHYLHIEGLRMGTRLKVRWQLDTVPKDALLPSLSLQPLLENAIYYGIQPLPEGGTILVTGLSDGHDIKIDIENPLPPPDAPIERRGSGHHIALSNVQQRLRFYYGRRGHLETDQSESVFRVSLRFPYETTQAPASRASR